MIQGTEVRSAATAATGHPLGKHGGLNDDAILIGTSVYGATYNVPACIDANTQARTDAGDAAIVDNVKSDENAITDATTAAIWPGGNNCIRGGNNCSSMLYLEWDRPRGRTSDGQGPKNV